MAENSKIEWTHHTFNPWPGCANCYAETMSRRNPAVLGEWGPQGKRVVAAENYWRQPLKWDREAKAAGERRRVFCASLADVFEGPETMPADSWGKVQLARERLFGSFENSEAGLIERTPNLDWLLLTKRPENVGRILNQLGVPGWFDWIAQSSRNVWLGVSVEDQARADERIPLLLRTPAAVRFLLCEPLLGPVDLTRWSQCEDCRIQGQPTDRSPTVSPCFERCGRGECCPLLHWVIAGGESGRDARPCNLDWLRSIVSQCKAANVPCFVKQLGSRPILNAVDQMAVIASYGSDRQMLLGDEPKRDAKGGNPDEWPVDLRVREFPGGQPCP